MGDIRRLTARQRERSDLYLRLLGGDATVSTFDIVVLMVQDDAQAEAFRREVQRGVDAGLYPRQSKYEFFPDKPAKCGNGGAIIASLHALTLKYGPDELDSARVLLLPCGGFSQRLPQYGPRGKIFAPVPFAMSAFERHSDGDGDGAAQQPRRAQEEQPCTMLQMKLMGYLDMVRLLPLGSCFVAWSDVLVFFDAGSDAKAVGVSADSSESVSVGAGAGAGTGAGAKASVRDLDFARGGFTVLGHEGSLSYGAAHAVMVLAQGDSDDAFSHRPRRAATYPCRHFFEKAPPALLRRAGAVVRSDGIGRAEPDGVPGAATAQAADSGTGGADDVVRTDTRATKAAAEEERDAEETVIVDSDFVFDRDTAKLLLEFHDANAPFGAGEDIDAGSHMQMACSVPFADDGGNPGAGEASGTAAGPSSNAAAQLSAQCSTGDKLFAFLRSRRVPIHAAVMLPSTFYHIGTMAEYLDFYSRGIAELGRATCVFCAVDDDTAAPLRRLPLGSRGDSCMLQCVISPSLERDGLGAGSVIEYSRLGMDCTVGRRCIVSNTVLAAGVRVPDDMYVSTIAVEIPGTAGTVARLGYVTHIFNIARDEIKCKQPQEQLFCGVPMAQAIAALGLSADQVWPGTAPHDLWHAKIFPVAATAEQSSSLAIQMLLTVSGSECGCEHVAVATATKATLTTIAGECLSMRDTFDVKCMSRDAEDRDTLWNNIAAACTAAS